MVERRTSSDDARPYWFAVQYTYSFNGESHSSGKHFRSDQGFADYGEAQRLVQRYPPGSKSYCYVNPSNPAEAILQRPSFWLALAIPFPLIFVAIGAGGIFLTWRTRADASVPEEKKPISSLAAAAKGAKFLVPVYSIFLLIGLGTFYAIVVRPVGQILAARGWLETPCVVVSSQVRSHSSDDGPTYSVDILYTYAVNGKEYKSNRYQFMGGASSGYGSKAEIVNRHPPGAHTVCYVNPRDPTQAVLERRFTSGLFFGLIPLAFILAGGSGIFFALRAARRDKLMSPAQRWLPKAARASIKPKQAASRIPDPLSLTGPVILRPTASPSGKLIATIVAAAFWNGIISVFVYQVFRGWQSGRFEWFLTIFLIPFVLVGLVLIGAVGYFFLASFNPRPVLTVSSSAVPLGDTLSLQWRLNGRVEAVERLRIYLEGREEATYRRGTATSTDKEVFTTLELANVTAHHEKRAGECRAAIPVNSMHSFESANNKIVWALKVEGQIRRWPDVKEEFPLVILPSPAKPPLPS